MAASTSDGVASSSSSSVPASVLESDDARAQPMAAASKTPSERATCILVLGMAGSGKSTFVQRITAHLHAQTSQGASPPYVVNLDPAVKHVNFPANIDIRDTVNYKEVMKQYHLGPNGGIMTCLNLFTTRFDQVLQVIDSSKAKFNHVIFDTPGQIEVFTWSASGSIITEALASQYPTVVVYVMDLARSVSPITFMSNMLYACSILYRMKLPFIVVMNKADLTSPKLAKDWMADFEHFHAALDEEKSYMSDLTRSLSLVLDDFYTNLRTVAVSALTGEGVDDFFSLVSKCRDEYFTEYRPEYDRLKAERDKAKVDEQARALERVQIDLLNDREKSKSKFAKMFRRSEQMQGVRIHLGGNADEDESEDEDDEGEEPQLERESFERFLQSQKGAAKVQHRESEAKKDA